MLILTRKMSEQILIGDDIVFTVVSVKGNRVKLGIDAPRSTDVKRPELIERDNDGNEKE